MVVLEHQTLSPLVEWRGPAPFYFLKLDPDEAKSLHDIVKDLTYGWGVIPVKVKIDEEVFETSIFPREGTFFVPVKKDIRVKTDIQTGQMVAATLYFSTK